MTRQQNLRLQLQTKDQELAILRRVLHVLQYGSDAAATKTLISLRRDATLKMLANAKALQIEKYAGVHTDGMHSGTDLCTANKEPMKHDILHDQETTFTPKLELHQKMSHDIALPPVMTAHNTIKRSRTRLAPSISLNRQGSDLLRNKGSNIWTRDRRGLIAHDSLDGNLHASPRISQSMQSIRNSSFESVSDKAQLETPVRSHSSLRRQAAIMWPNGHAIGDTVLGVPYLFYWEVHGARDAS